MNSFSGQYTITSTNLAVTAQANLLGLYDVRSASGEDLGHYAPETIVYMLRVGAWTGTAGN